MAENYFSKTPKFNPAAFKQGVNLGMFSPFSPEFSLSPETKSSFGNAQNILRQMSEAGIDIKNISPEKIFDYATVNQLLTPYTNREEDWKYKKQELDYASELQWNQARRAQELAKDSTREAFKYAMLQNIPKTIAQGFANAAGIRLQSARNQADIISQIASNLPSINVPGFSYQPTKYFG